MSHWPPQTVVVASDHAAVALRKQIVALLLERNIAVTEIGPEEGGSCDYPETSAPAAALVQEGQVDAGVLLCGSGIGQSIVANRFTGVRAARVHSTQTTILCRQHNNANVLVLGARMLEASLSRACVTLWLDTPFEGGRHERRTNLIDELTDGYPWLGSSSVLARQDPELFAAVQGEQERQEYQLEMIASENMVSAAVMQAAGTVLTNKYAEGYPNKRYYGGCSCVDVAEQLAIDRACQLFGASYANVQPHSGSQANMAAYLALAKPGETILGMSLSHGGHLTHGAKVNFSGQIYVSDSYEIDTKSGRIDLDTVLARAKELRPSILVAGASAYPRQIDFSGFRKIADEVGAKLVVDMAHVAGLVATGLHPSPIGVAHVVTSTTHKTLRGPRGGLILATDEALTRPLNSKIFPGIQGGPLMHIIAAKAVAFGEALQPSFRTYMEQVVANAAILGEILVNRGYDLVSGGTDNHLVLVNFGAGGISGKDAEVALEEAGITVNKNTVPNETRSPFVTSGIRIGTPAITSRGIHGDAMRSVAAWIADVLDEPDNPSVRARVQASVREICLAHPLYRFDYTRAHQADG